MLNINQDCESFAREVQKTLHTEGFYVDLNLDPETVQKKIKLAQEAQYNYILVIGTKEVAERKVNVRTRDGVVHGMKSVEDILNDFKREAKPWDGK